MSFFKCLVRTYVSLFSYFRLQSIKIVFLCMVRFHTEMLFFIFLLKVSSKDVLTSLNIIMKEQFIV